MTWNNQNCAEKGAKITLLALYEKTIYQNEKNGFCIFRMTRHRDTERAWAWQRSQNPFFCNRVLSACNP